MAVSESEIFLCWVCGSGASIGDAFCSICDVIQPPHYKDMFCCFQLPYSFDLDKDRLVMLWQERQLALHPDRFALSGSKEKLFAQQQSMYLNDAFETLVDPVKRAHCLLEIMNPSIEKDTQVADSAFLEEIFLKRSRLQKVKRDDFQQLKEMVIETENAMLQVCSLLSDLFHLKQLEKVPAQIIQLQYLQKLLEEIKQKKLQIE